ncbi:helix-turn-helix domain-containing protein [Leisingera sp. S232]|uniref:helix-turn-helix domain-containing protein n=1 Tax=Leisingera sp. S232 TaxID=3415132 RepID=UPI003C7C7206
MLPEQTPLETVDEVHPTEDGDSGGSSRRRTIYSEDVIRDIKREVKLVWDREKRFKKLTQEKLALRLGLKQSAVSKLLNDDTGHPWTVDKIEKFASYCDVPISEIVKDEGLIGYFNGWEGPTLPPEKSRIEEAKSALKSFLDEYGRDLSEPKLFELAGKLAVRVEGTERSIENYNKEIMQLLISEL